MNQIDYRKNGLDFVRYYAALSVMALHFSGWYMIYCDNSNNRIADLFRSISLSIPGVVVFFAISGFFAMASLGKAYETNSDCPIKYFFTNKLVRIFPEYWLCTIINAVVIIILAYDKLDKSFVLWLGTQLFGIANTPSCLKGFATGSVNGPLWTVFVQIQIYVVIALTYKYLQKISKVGWGIIILLSVVANALCEYIANASGGGVISKLIERSVVPYFLWAILGAFIFRYIDDIIPVLKKTWWVLFVILLVFGRLTYLKDTVATYGYYTGIVIGILTPFAAIGCAYALPSKRVKDISYSIFLYQWIVINIIIHFNLFNTLGGLWCLAIFVIGTLILSVLSNTIIRRVNRNINLKRRI